MTATAAPSPSTQAGIITRSRRSASRTRIHTAPRARRVTLAVEPVGVVALRNSSSSVGGRLTSDRHADLHELLEHRLQLARLDLLDDVPAVGGLGLDRDPRQVAQLASDARLDRRGRSG